MRKLSLAIVLLGCCVMHPGAQTPPPIDELVSALGQADWTSRMKAFYGLVRLGNNAAINGSYSLPAAIQNLMTLFPADADLVKLGLIGLLTQENAWAGVTKAEFLASGGTRGTVTEEFTDYYGDVVVAVATLSDDRSADALLGALHTGFLLLALWPRLDRSYFHQDCDSPSADEVLRGDAVLVLWEMLKPENRDRVKDSTSMSKIRIGLNWGAADTSSVVRSLAHEGLASLYDIPITAPVVTARIDIMPDSSSNTVNLGAGGVVPVVVFSTTDFDSTSMVSSTLSFGPRQASESHGRMHVIDANRDGLSDVVLHFNVADSGIACGDTATFLLGRTSSGSTVMGSDSIRTIGCSR